MDFADLESDISYEDRLSFVKRHNPQMSDEQVEAYLVVLIHRKEKKQELLNRGFSNRLAEHSLDRMQIPRPWGWHTVFFYPDSNTPRTRYIVIAVAALLYFFWRNS